MAQQFFSWLVAVCLIFTLPFALLLYSVPLIPLVVLPTFSEVVVPAAVVPAAVVPAAVVPAAVVPAAVVAAAVVASGNKDSKATRSHV